MITRNDPRPPSTRSFQYQFKIIGPTQVPSQQQLQSIDCKPSQATTSDAIRPAQLIEDQSLLPQRKHITRACDECRRKKIKCDGEHPCIHCKVFFYGTPAGTPSRMFSDHLISELTSLDCTYDKPLIRKRRMPPARNTEALENRLRRMEAFVATIVPDLSTQNPGAKPAPKPREASGKSDEHDSLRLTTAKPSPEAQVGAPSDDYFLETLVTATGKLVLEGRDKWRYHGNSSYAAFLERMRDELGDWVIGR
ncbi:MAG: hypothetical protein M1830_004448 [Pleopsidium flavum]|nr:MAG: hypothetical protein M1830_004448 [Pleopsidium flavum]